MKPEHIEIAEQIARDASCAQGEFDQRVLSIIPYLTDVCDRASLVGVERAAPPLRAREEIAALRELYEWYDRDGSVGVAADVFQKHRALLAQRIEHEPSERVAEPLLAEESQS